MKKILALFIVATLTACSGNPGIPYSDVFNDNRPGFQTEAFQSKALTDSTRNVVTDFVKNAPWFKSHHNQTILVGLFSDSVSYTKTRAIGRSAAKELVKQLNSIYDIKAGEFRLTNAMMRPLTNGYMSSTSDALYFAQRQHADIMILGTTTIQTDSILVKLNIIDVQTGNVAGKYDYSIPVDADLSKFITKP